MTKTINKIIINIKSSNVNDEFASLMVYQCLSGRTRPITSGLATFEREGKKFMVSSEKKKNQIFTIYDEND